MVGIVAVLVVVTLSVVATRVGAAALEATGVSEDLAHFQARSAFTGVGYTTREARDVLLRIAVLVGGLASLWAFSSTRWFNRAVRRALRRLLQRWTELDVRDYVQLLDVSGDHAVRDVRVGEGDWLHEHGVTRHEHARAAEQARDRQAEVEQDPSNPARTESP